MVSVVETLQNQVNRMFIAIQSLYRIYNKEHDSLVKATKHNSIGWSEIPNETSANFIHGEMGALI